MAEISVRQNDGIYYEENVAMLGFFLGKYIFLGYENSIDITHKSKISEYGDYSSEILKQGTFVRLFLPGRGFAFVESTLSQRTWELSINTRIENSSFDHDEYYADFDIPDQLSCVGVGSNYGSELDAEVTLHLSVNVRKCTSHSASIKEFSFTPVDGVFTYDEALNAAKRELDVLNEFLEESIFLSIGLGFYW